MILSLLGVSFKIAAAPMHFYAADVYEGAAAPVTAFLAFVPKTAGMIAIILLLATIGWGDANGATPEMPRAVLTTIAIIVVPFFSGQIIEGARRATRGYNVPLNAAEQAGRDVVDDALPRHAARPEQTP